MDFEKIKDKELREKMEALMQMGQMVLSASSEEIAAISQSMPHENDIAFWLPPDKRVIHVGERVDKPADTVVPTLVLEHFIRNASHRTIMNFCGCRKTKSCENFPVECGCLFLGDSARQIHPEIGKPATVDEALDYVARCRELGLIHHLGLIEKDSVWLEVSDARRLLTVCHCCPCCCGVMSDSYPDAARALHNIKKMPGVKVLVSKDCVGCEACVSTCTFAG
jgi:hypothetical protein